jgi:ribosomal protein L35
MKTNKGIFKRFKITKPKKGTPKLVHQSKGRGSRHLKTKQTNKRKRRIRQRSVVRNPKKFKRIVKVINT